MPMAAAVAWMHIGNQVIELSTMSPFVNKQSILAANDTLLNWVQSVIASN
jgi:hypothetical protein